MALLEDFLADINYLNQEMLTEIPSNIPEDDFMKTVDRLDSTLTSVWNQMPVLKQRPEQEFGKIQFCLRLIIQEFIKNAAWHGNKSDPKKLIKLGIYFGSDSLLITCQDDGDFLRNPDNARKYEQRYHFKKTHELSSELGLELIYQLCNPIKVDESTGTIYAVMSYGC